MSEKDFWEGYVPEPVKPAPEAGFPASEQQKPVFSYTPDMDAVRRAEKEKADKFLAHLAQQALDKKAENARELGLMPYNGGDYEPAPVQQEWIETACALIKAADDAAHDSDYMLDSNDCIKVLRGQWNGPLMNDQPAAPQPAQQEPVAWRAPNWGHSDDEWVYRDFDDPVLIADGKPSPNNDPLYTSPPAQRTWVGLFWGELPEDGQNHDFLRGAVWAETKLKEKNT